MTLAPRDADAGLLLSTEAGWNQTADDWAWHLGVGQGFGVRAADGSLVASAVALPYPPFFGWVSMVLVTASRRRQGLAARLVARCVARLREEGLTPMLDATPAGRAVYLAAGFQDVETIGRWRGQGTGVRLGSTSEIDAALDRRAFGADRGVLLRHLAERDGSVVLGDCRGYAVLRRGRTASHVGPISAASGEGAASLLRAAVACATGPVLVDAPDRAVRVVEALEALGFARDRNLLRMAQGRASGFGEPDLVGAIAGPDYG